MAYISTEEVRAIRKALKEAFPKYRFSVSRSNYSAVAIALMKGDVEIEKEWLSINEYHLHTYSQEIQNIFNKVKEVMFKNAEYHDNSDSMTDYFDVAYYYDFSIGKWDKPYQKI